MLEKVGSMEISNNEYINIRKILEENGYRLVLIENNYASKVFIISKEGH